MLLTVKVNKLRRISFGEGWRRYLFYATTVYQTRQRVNDKIMNLRQLREKNNLRTVDVASVVGVGESTVRNWEKGRTLPTLSIYQTGKLLDLYCCSFDELKEAVENSQIKMTTKRKTATS